MKIPEALLVIRSWLPVLFVTLLAVGCGSVRLAYNNADRLLGVYADDLLDLSDAQEDAWQPRLEDVLARHRAEQIPVLVNLLDDTGKVVEGGVDEPRLACVLDRVRVAWRGSASLLAEAAAPLLASLEPAQIDYLQERLRERDEDYRDDHLDPDPETRHAERVARLVKRIQRWTGRLDVDQRALVERQVRGWPPLAEGWHDYRRGRQQQLLTLLRSGASDAELRAYLYGWWGSQSHMPAALQAARGEVEAGMVRLLVEVETSLDDKQRERVSGELRSLRDALAGLVPETALTTAGVGECSGNVVTAGVG